MAAQPPTGIEYLRQRDEVLEVLYWAEGEGIGTSLSSAQLALFMAATLPELDPLLQNLSQEGLLRRVADGWSLTAIGRDLGGRSFALDFREWMVPAHGDCGPGCPCQGGADPAACRVG